MGPLPEPEFRAARPEDDARVAHIIRTVLGDQRCGGEDSPLHDDELDGICAAYTGTGAAFYVVEIDGEVLGCGGFQPCAGTPATERVVELRKMYFLPSLRGRGVGRRFLEFLMDRMQECGHRQVYLETAVEMAAARHLYTTAGFRQLDHRIGDSGHGACNLWFLRTLEPS